MHIKLIKWRRVNTSSSAFEWYTMKYPTSQFCKFWRYRQSGACVYQEGTSDKWKYWWCTARKCCTTISFYATENTETNLIIAAQDRKVGCQAKNLVSSDSLSLLWHGIAANFKMLLIFFKKDTVSKHYQFVAIICSLFADNIIPTLFQSVCSFFCFNLKVCSVLCYMLDKVGPTDLVQLRVH